MTGLEPMLVELLLQRAKMGYPLQQNEGLAFANSLIQGSDYQKELIKYQKQNVRMKTTNNNIGKLSTKYWRNFLRRNSSVIDNGIPVSQAVCRKEWSTYANFKLMYDLCYEQMDKANLLQPLEKPVWMNLQGSIVEKDAAVGLKVAYRCKHSDYMIFVDEVGNNTNMKDDGNIGGERMIKARGAKA